MVGLMKLFKYVKSRWNRYYSITFFDYKLKEYGGHGHIIARIINNKLINKLFYLEYAGIGIATKPQLGYYSTWYDGQHNVLWLGFVCIDWGGSPHLEIDWIIPRFK